MKIKNIINKSMKLLKGFFLQNNSNLLSEVDKLNIRLKELFKLDEGFVVALNGEWGIGKTHFWNAFIEKNLIKEQEEKKIAYISLFGKDKLSDIESDIILQVSKRAKIKENLDKYIGSIGIYGAKISSLVALIPKSDFRDTIICFDDFERKSKKIDSADILGLITQFKEQKNCKIIMIYNEIEILDKKVLSNYKDKVIDYELHYKPTVKESYLTVSSRLKAFTSYPLKYLNSKGINNIRVIKRLINSLNDFEFLASELIDYPIIEEEIIYNLMRLSTVNAKYSDFDLNKLIKYVEKKRLSENKKFDIDNEFENMLYLLDINNDYFFSNEILENIIYYIKNSIIDKESLLKIIKEKKLNYEKDKIGIEVRNVYLEYTYNLKYDSNKFVKDMSEILEKGGDSIVEIVGVESFMYYIEEMDRINNQVKYKQLGIEKIKLYLDYIYLNNRVRELQSFGKLTKIKEFDSSLDKYIEEKEEKIKSKKVQSEEDIIKLFTDPVIKSSWGIEPELLANIDKEVYKKYIEESPNFFMEAVDFVSWTKGFSNGSGFEESVKKIIETFEELKSVPEYTDKINRVLKRYN
jgi:hypothetical protein